MEQQLMERIRTKLEHRIVPDYDVNENADNRIHAIGIQPVDNFDNSAGAGDTAFSNETSHDGHYNKN